MFPLVYLVRHGQTAWNVEYRLQGQADIALNEEGRRQASANGRHLAQLIADPKGFDFVASPMLRTRTTMELVRSAMALDPKAYRTDPRLMEMSFGDWQGFTMAELEARQPGSTKGRSPDKWDFVPPGKGAESYQMLLERVRPFFEELSRPTVCVTHGGVMRALFRMVEKLPKPQAARVETPQDRILRLKDGRLEWL
jgi:probable phosphoglycerate mutase